MLFWKKKSTITRPDGWLKVGYQDTNIRHNIKWGG